MDVDATFDGRGLGVQVTGTKSFPFKNGADLVGNKAFSSSWIDINVFRCDILISTIG